jgi:hypothetical protein
LLRPAELQRGSIRESRSIVRQYKKQIGGSIPQVEYMMFKQKKKKRIAAHLCSVVLMTVLFGRSAPSQPRLAPEMSGRFLEPSVALPAYGPSLAPRGFKPTDAEASRKRIGKALMRAINEAWRMSGDGMSTREGAVLIFRMTDGTYTGRVQRFTNEQFQLSFAWDPAAVAIVHTHPNGRDPKPAEQDKRVAEKLGVPNFTVSINGMYVYDPATRKTTKVLSGLDWLNRSIDPDELKRWLGAENLLEPAKTECPPAAPRD